MSRVLIVAIALGISSAVFAAGTQPAAVPLTFIERLPSGYWSKIAIEPVSSGAVSLSYSSGVGEEPAKVERKSFEPPVLEELKKMWGNAPFDASVFESDHHCERQTTWWLGSGTAQRRICRDKGLIARLEKLHGTVLLLMH